MLPKLRHISWRYSPVAKNRVLETIADELEAQTESILSANAQDVEQARENGLSEAMLDRLALTPARLKAIADDVRRVISLTRSGR